MVRNIRIDTIDTLSIRGADIQSRNNRSRTIRFVASNICMDTIDTYAIHGAGIKGGILIESNAQSKPDHTWFRSTMDPHATECKETAEHWKVIFDIRNEDLCVKLTLSTYPA